MEKSTTRTDNWKVRRSKTTISLAIWAMAYVLTAIPAAFGSEFWISNEWLTTIAILVNLGIGIGMIVANINHLKALDEMMQKIQMEASGIALGVGVIGGLSYGLLDTENIIPFDAEIGYLVILIGITYFLALIFGCRKLK